MGFWVFLSLLCSGYCLYKVHELGLIKKEEAQKKQLKQNPIMFERLQPLVGKACEIKVSKPMVFIDVLHSLKGIVVDVDDEWVVILGKKDMQYVIRLTMIKDVAQIL